MSSEPPSQSDRSVWRNGGLVAVGVAMLVAGGVYCGPSSFRKAKTQAPLVGKRLKGPTVDPGTSAAPRLSPPKDASCHFPDKGFGAYTEWSDIDFRSTRGIYPKAFQTQPPNEVDVLIHFHGENPYRKVFVQSFKRLVLVGATWGAGSSRYDRPFRKAGSFKELKGAIIRWLSKSLGISRLRVRHWALSGWSAGYGAIRRILWSHPHKNVGAVMALDGVHSDLRKGGGRQVAPLLMGPIEKFGHRALLGETWLWISHSQIATEKYASTTETARYLAKAWGLKPKPSLAQAGSSSRLTAAEAGQLRLWGFQGKNKEAHCAQLYGAELMLSELRKAWGLSEPAPAAPSAVPAHSFGN